MNTSMIVVIISFLALMPLGFPVLYVLEIPGLIWLAMNKKMPVTILSQNMMAYLNSSTLLRLPGFMLVGRLMGTCDITDRLFNLSLVLIGRFRGEMAYVNCVVSAMLASMSGSVIADAGELGLVEMKMMKQASYDSAFSADMTAASSTTGSITPPGTAMALLRAISQTSVVSMFFERVIPGVPLCSTLCFQVFLIVHLTKKKKATSYSPISIRQALTITPEVFPALPTFIIILGSIPTGICTIAEAAAIAVWYPIFSGIRYRKVTIRNLWGACKDAAEACGPLSVIITSASMFSQIITREGLLQMIASVMQRIAENPSVIVVTSMCVVISPLIGCLTDITAIVLLLAPIIMPAVKSMDIDPAYFGALMILSLMVGIVAPPFGICLFIVSGITKLPAKTVAKEAVRYIPGMLAAIALIISFPRIVEVLPNLLSRQ